MGTSGSPREQYPRFKSFGDLVLGRAWRSGYKGIHEVGEYECWENSGNVNTATNFNRANLSYDWQFAGADIYCDVTKSRTFEIFASDTAHMWRVGTTITITGFYAHYDGDATKCYESGDTLRVEISAGSGTTFWKLWRKEI